LTRYSINPHLYYKITATMTMTMATAIYIICEDESISPATSFATAAANLASEGGLYSTDS
jgi:hypothetical protein